MTRASAPLFALEPPPPGCAPRVVVCGVPFDDGNGVAPGARDAPAALRAQAVGPGALERGLRASLTGLQGLVDDVGNVEWLPGEPREWMDARVAHVCGAAWEAGAGLLLLGGDHSVTRGAVERAQAAAPLAVLWLDAHTDTAAGDALTHKTVARTLLALPGVSALVQVGFRGFTLEDELGWRLEKRTLVTVEALRQLGPAAALAALPAGTRLYVSIDVDLLDPAVAPGTATPVPGGLGVGEVAALLREAVRGRRLVGCDLVEVNPGRDHASRTVQAGCVLLREAVALLAAASTHDGYVSRDDEWPADAGSAHIDSSRDGARSRTRYPVETR
jgi:agmatinase